MLLAGIQLLSQKQNRRWLTDSRSLFCQQLQKTNEKKAAPLTKPSLKYNEGSLVTPYFCGCCGTRTNNVLRHPRRTLHRKNECLGLFRWGKGKSKLKAVGFHKLNPIYELVKNLIPPAPLIKQEVDKGDREVKF